MSLQTLQIITLLTALAFLFAQLLVVKKQTSHVLFAIFCGSIAMSLTKDISGNAIGEFKYLIGMGACATCNCYWLLSRSLFRGKNSISTHHLLVAAAIALLVLINQGYLFAHNANLVSTIENSFAQYILRELTILLSSCILVLTFWEGCREFSSASRKGKTQRILFLATFGCAVATAKISQGLFADDLQAHQMVLTSIILFILISTQILITWRFKAAPATQMPESTNEDPEHTATPEPIKAIAVDESLLANQVKLLIVDEALFLQPNLKIADVARHLDVPEYRVSNALRHNLNARNFNQYINELRIRHAQSLLADSDKQKWPVLVVGLESGFASVGPFTRAFKALTACTPNQYRKNLAG